jgi:hypothetical protein
VFKIFDIFWFACKLLSASSLRGKKSSKTLLARDFWVEEEDVR